VGRTRIGIAGGSWRALALVVVGIQLMGSTPPGAPDPGRSKEEAGSVFLRAPRLDLLYDYAVSRDSVARRSPRRVFFDPGAGVLEFDLIYSAPGWHGSGPRRVELSPLGRIAYGADKGAYLGLFAGYLGTLAGAWDDETALKIMAAGAALGGIYAGTLGPSRVQVRVSPD
jgi:hypothetical protein